jgi:hypothetical protein
MFLHQRFFKLKLIDGNGKNNFSIGRIQNTGRLFVVCLDILYGGIREKCNGRFFDGMFLAKCLCTEHTGEKNEQVFHVVD